MKLIAFKGAFGKVKLATQKSTGMTRAVKIVSRQGLSKNEEKALKNEIEILQALVNFEIILKSLFIFRTILI